MNIDKPLSIETKTKESIETMYNPSKSDYELKTFNPNNENFGNIKTSDPGYLLWLSKHWLRS
ncbi:hypothetical protein J7L02_00005 [Candidatus Woesearchaeota archaeon]|nr:hypothetical protein [Candidatus Woesearchaeota archaeon]